MNKHAYLVISHNNFYILKKIIQLLDSEFNDIYIHIDARVKKFDFEYYTNIAKKSKVIFLTENMRIKVYWGNYSLVQCELNLLECALTRKEAYSYFHLISGVDLPIKRNIEIYRYFEENRGKEFITYEEPWPYDRVRYNYILTKTFRLKNIHIARLAYLIRSIYILIQKVIRFDETKKYSDFVYKKGSQWFSITNECARFICDNKNQIEKMFKKKLYPDEHFLQTILFNSKYKNSIVGDTNKRLVDWKRGNPYTYKITDIDELMESECLFARKFDVNTDKQIIDKIYEKLMV